VKYKWQGFFLFQEMGCQNKPGLCPDGTVCDEHAECIKPLGSAFYICKCKVKNELFFKTIYDLIKLNAIY